FQQTSGGKAVQAQQLRVYDAGGAGQDQIGENLTCRRRVHHAVSAEAVRQIKALDFINRAEDAVMVGRDLVESGPCALRIYSKVLEHRHAIGGARQDLLDEPRLEIGLETGRFLWIVPRQKKAE